jgi:hypothetical protein
MRPVLLFIISFLAIAGTPEIQVPRPEPPKAIQFKIPLIPWWNSAEKAYVASQSPFSNPEYPSSKPKAMPLLLPYPCQAPLNARSYFFLQ